MKKLIPFTLERWQQGNCTVKTADGRDVTDLLYQPTEKNGYPLCGLLNGTRQTWRENGIYHFSPTGGYNLMLEVDCEVVYVSIMRLHEKEYYTSISHLPEGWQKHPNFIKEIKVEL